MYCFADKRQEEKDNENNVLVSNQQMELVMRNLAAKSLADRQFQQKIVIPKRGKGSYSRKIKHLKRD
jgi:stalled ribosome alternative rescue factor ArfA